jgi:hypothetical protein
MSFLTMLLGENATLDEDSWRDRQDLSINDVSGGLPHLSIQHAAKLGVPGYDAARGVTDAANKAAWREWSTDVGRSLPVAREWFETQIKWAEGSLGNDTETVPLLAACLWNAPAAGAVDEARKYGLADPRTRKAAADFWLSDDLKQRSPKYFANRQNYIRGLAQAEQYRVTEEPMATTEERLAQLEKQQSLQSEAIAQILANHYQDGPGSAKGQLVQLNKPKYEGLVVVEKANLA